MSNKTQIRQTINRILSPVPAPAPVPSVRPAPEPVPPKYTDKIITCVECAKSFVWNAGEQEYYNKRGVLNAPKHCPACKARRRQYFNNHPNQGQK